jgi:hypothetical protein
VAQAQLELLRIRGVRAKLMSAINLTTSNLEHLQRLAALDRYERFAHTKRQRASRKLQIPAAEIERRGEHANDKRSDKLTKKVTPRAICQNEPNLAVHQSDTMIRTVLSERTHLRP